MQKRKNKPVKEEKGEKKSTEKIILQNYLFYTFKKTFWKGI